ncbi:hypothetical protein LWI28_026686 [Acer negundo]|uniref:Uncharacterized protein n=1 Tax=Acer negundo TaxID=4023 RepID=A0AAD5JEA0_ACENE|nr:hypothetical protein LWI28_026686 [Acer negundo]
MLTSSTVILSVSRLVYVDLLDDHPEYLLVGLCRPLRRSPRITLGWSMATFSMSTSSSVILNVSMLVYVDPLASQPQDIHTKEKIGSGKQSGGLYYLEDRFQQSNREVQVHLVNENVVNKKKDEIWL